MVSSFYHLFSLCIHWPSSFYQYSVSVERPEPAWSWLDAHYTLLSLCVEPLLFIPGHPHFPGTWAEVPPPPPALISHSFRPLPKTRRPFHFCNGSLGLLLVLPALLFPVSPPRDQNPLRTRDPIFFLFCILVAHTSSLSRYSFLTDYDFHVNTSRKYRSNTVHGGSMYYLDWFIIPPGWNSPGEITKDYEKRDGSLYITHLKTITWKWVRRNPENS